MLLTCTYMSCICHLYVTRMSSVCHSYAIRLSFVCTRMSSVCHSYVIVYHSYVIRMSLLCTRMSSVCHSYVLECHPYVTRMRFDHEPLELEIFILIKVQGNNFIIKKNRCMERKKRHSGSNWLTFIHSKVSKFLKKQHTNTLYCFANRRSLSERSNSIVWMRSFF